MGSWQKVYADKHEYRAEIVKAVLEDQGMSPILINKKDAAYQFGYFELHVSPEEVIRSIKIITDDVNFD